jgi:uncharacterized protein (UPF0303 family)
MRETTGGFSSAELARESATLILSSLTQSEALEIGEIAAMVGRDRSLPIAEEDHLLCVEVITEYLARKGELA